MRIINLRFDEEFFEKMKKDKIKKGIPNWESYFISLFKNCESIKWELGK